MRAKETREESGAGWRLDEVLAATGGRVCGPAGAVTFRRISTDTRTIAAGDLFVALSGENFDGETFLAEAVSRGAAGALVSREPSPPASVPVIVVGDTLRALGDLAAWRRRQLPNLQVLAITGSSGKTTVKEMTAAILARKFPLLKTTGNFNNLIGLPLTLLKVNEKQRLAVLEMGMNHPGEIARLTEIAAPDFACINNIHGAHLLGLEDIHGVARAKAELFAGLAPTATMIVNLDDPLIRAMARRYSQKQITFGLHRRAQVRATYIRLAGEAGIAFTLKIGREQIRVRLHCVGRHNVVNALAAAALAHGVGLGLEDIRQGLAEFTPYDKRMQVERLASGLRVVNDTYNANPASMLAALETVHGLRGSHRAVAVLGDMLELGRESAEAHRRIGATVAGLGFNQLLVIGAYAGEMVAAARAVGMNKKNCRVCADHAEIVEQLRMLQKSGELAAGDWLLVKGSRGMKMETVIAGLKEVR
ncbi:MAG TPA: UDP-N-acetylmuramoyl-tripeptide--D-alanyl-D-alanine ligase [Desulfurivibrionaceae bacterium]|nr:UDP-N-acetylmuramoyl-tripeptide--D-alanyl-D-alanine ligase [Desulfurivibrionaceae bacterium]